MKPLHNILDGLLEGAEDLHHRIDNLNSDPAFGRDLAIARTKAEELLAWLKHVQDKAKDD